MLFEYGPTLQKIKNLLMGAGEITDSPFLTVYVHCKKTLTGISGTVAIRTSGSEASEQNHLITFLMSTFQHLAEKNTTQARF